MADPKANPRRLEMALIIVTIVGVALATIYYDHFPGTLAVDSEGIVRGSGERVTPYRNGQPRVTEKYIAGYLRGMKWHRSDGTLVIESAWKQGSGDMYVVDEDGTIRAKVPYVLGIPNGEATFFNPDGSIKRTGQFVEGIEHFADDIEQ